MAVVLATISCTKAFAESAVLLAKGKGTASVSPLFVPRDMKLDLEATVSPYVHKTKSTQKMRKNAFVPLTIIQSTELVPSALLEQNTIQ